MFLIGDDVSTISDPNANFALKALAVVDIVSNVALVIPVAGEEARFATKGATVIGRGLLIREAGEVSTREAPQLLRRIVGVCPHCFPAGTLVATPNGKTAIDKLQVGEQVLSENPASGKVEAESVQAVIKDPVSLLVAVALSDNSAITVTADHPFWVDSGAGPRNSTWIQAGELKRGYRLRTLSGQDVLVTGLRSNVGHAIVYTLTVANDHTFFVGDAGVLVHNSSVCDEVLKRFGPSYESANRLGRKAAQAEQVLGHHGVSVTAGETAIESSSSPREAIERFFRVINSPTRGDPLHRTIILPNPVTQEDADLFNKLFGRSR